jgi:hypothetical protein
LVNDLGIVKAVDRLGQAVADAAERRFHPGFRNSSGVED